MDTDSKVVFILYGTVLNISEIVAQVKESGKMAFINVDLLEGFAHKEIVFQYIKKYTGADSVSAALLP